jgi:hypothetical protein
LDVEGVYLSAYEYRHGEGEEGDGGRSEPVREHKGGFTRAGV